MKKQKNIFARAAQNIWDVVARPRRFFGSIVADGNMEESMLKAFIYGLVGGIAVLIIQLIGGATVTFSAVFSKVIIVPVLAVAILFVLGGLLMLISEITGGERDWEIAVKGLASVFFVYPIILILNAIAWNCTSLWIVSIIVDLYVLFLIYNIAIFCLRGNKTRVLIVVGALVLFLITIYATDYRAGWLLIKNSSAALKCLI